MAKTCRVLNKRTDVIPPDAVYVGRPSKWGNPYKIGKDGSRDDVIRLYRAALLAALNAPNAWKEMRFQELQGHDLVCWCAPLPCHADVLMELANKEETL